MSQARLPDDEEMRLRTLAAYDILDTPNEEGFDRLARLAATLCETPIALITLIDRHRQWVKSGVGLETRSMPREVAFCSHAIVDDGVLVVEDAKADSRFCDNVLVLATPKIRFYAGAPIHAYNGVSLGALCVIDRVPRRLREDQHAALVDLSREVETQLELRRSKRGLDDLLRRHALLTSMMVHDMRSSLGAILMGGEFFLSSNLSGEGTLIAGGIVTAAEDLQRMTLNLLDNNRIGAVLEARCREVDLGELWTEITHRLERMASVRERELKVELDTGCGRIETDPDLVRRILENLVDNALKVAPAGTAVIVHVTCSGDMLMLRVCDEGPGVPAADRERIFDPYVQLGNGGAPRGGLGLGLAFCRKAAEVLGGRIWVEPRRPRGSMFCVDLEAARKSSLP